MMKRNILDELVEYNPITIQCHDNPDADAIASGYGLYLYFSSLKKDVRLIYSGRNKITKSNLVAMVNKYDIPINYVDAKETPKVDGLLITVDCQYGAGNVTKIEADEVAMIDHHRIEIEGVEKNVILSHIGSCSTIIWKLLTEVGFEITDDLGLGTCLYYGLYTDTNQMSEISSPVDKDAAEELPCAKNVIMYFKNCNISVEELDIASVAMLSYDFNDKYGFAIVKSQPCDPNILGLIADFMLQVDKFDVCVVFNETQDGYKLSVRSCIKEVNASELVQFLTEEIGSGGGHYEKAGGFISRKIFYDKYNIDKLDAYLNDRMVCYYESYEIIHSSEYEADYSTMKKYQKQKFPVGYVKMSEVLPIGTPIMIRTLECDMDLVVEDDLYVLIGIRGEVYPNKAEKFKRAYELLEGEYIFEECAPYNMYVPRVKNRLNGDTLNLAQHAKKCVPSGDVQIYGRPLEKGVKVFVEWDKERYMLGKPGDVLAVRSDDAHDVYIIEGNIFKLTYREV